MAAALLRDSLIPRDLDVDGQVCWWVLGAIGRHNGNAPQHGWVFITTADLWTWDDEDWQHLADDTPEILGPITIAQRARIVATLFGLERHDIERHADDRWWDR